MADQPVPSETTPDLASLLKSLAGYTRQQQDQAQVPPQQIPEAAPYINQQSHIQEATITQQPYQPIPQQFPQSQQYPYTEQYGYAPQPVQNFGPPQSFLQQNQVNLESSRKVVDPSTIIDWPSGLKCVMKTVARHDQMIYEIRKMIKTQREHEEQWWNSRQALIEKQKNRIEEREKLASVLRSVGSTAPSNPTTPTETAASEASELLIFDTKVYRAQLQMVKEMSTKLKSMGVPFFGTRSELVRISSQKNDVGAGTVSKADVGGLNLDGPSEVNKENGGRKIDEEELIKLQRRMLGILEDLCEG